MKRLITMLVLSCLSAATTMPAYAWTDYNTHDPGITTLQALSYSLTSASYWSWFVWPW